MKGAENLFQGNNDWKFPNLEKKTDIQIRELPNKRNSKRPTPRHFIIKASKVKDKEKLLKSKRKTTGYIQRNPVRL